MRQPTKVTDLLVPDFWEMQTYNFFSRVSDPIMSKKFTITLLYRIAWLLPNKLLNLPLFPSSLIELNLSKNKLQFLYHDAFKDLKNLQSLDLSRNHLRHLTQTIFNGLKELTNLEFERNKLSRLSYEIFNNLDKLLL